VSMTSVNVGIPGFPGKSKYTVFMPTIQQQ